MAGWEPKLDHRLIQMQVCGSFYKTFACIFQNSPSPVKILKISYMFDSSDEGSIWCFFQRCVYCCVFSTAAYIFYFDIILGKKNERTVVSTYLLCLFMKSQLIFVSEADNLYGTICAWRMFPAIGKNFWSDMPNLLSTKWRKTNSLNRLQRNLDASFFMLCCYL